MKRFFLLILSLSTLIVNASYFRSYQMEDGLSHNSVWAVMQDQQGFMWFGTNDGLNRFDGRNFKVFKKNEHDSLSIGNNFIHCLKEDSQGRFLVGTKNGLYQYHQTTETFTTISLKPSGEISVNDIYETPNGDIWIACHGQGVYLLDKNLSVKKHYESNDTTKLPNNFIWTIIQDYVGNIWLGTVGDGLVLFDAQQERFIKMADEQDFDIQDPIINTLFCDADYNLWVGTATSGLYRYNYRTGKTYNYMNKEAFNIKSIIEYSENELIMGCDKGLVTFNRITETFRMLSNEMDNMTDNSIFALAKDREGAFWIGTYFGGVNYFSPTINTFDYYYNTSNTSAKKSIISSFAQENEEKLWVGSYNNGLALFNPVNGQFEQADIKIDYNNVQDLYYDDGYLYISLYGQGICVLNTHTLKTKHLGQSEDLSKQISNFVTTIFKSQDGLFWFASEEGVSVYDPSQQTARKIKYLNGYAIKDILEDYNGAKWFASHTHGLFRLNADKTWDSYSYVENVQSPLPSNHINCIFQDSKFRIWAGTEDAGLLLFDARNNSFKQLFTESNGLPSNIVYAIQNDTDGNLWITTGRGLCKVTHDLQDIVSIGYIDDVQRIRYNPKASIRLSDNKLFFGGTNGFIAFYPQAIKLNQQKPNLVITRFNLLNTIHSKERKDQLPIFDIEKENKITLERKNSTFSVEFVALSYLAPSENQYAYMLEGFDTDWTYTTDNKAYYMNIPPGEYIFKVKGSNNDDVWSDMHQIIIKVKPPFLLSIGMIFLYVFLLIGIISLILHRYQKRIAQKNKEQIYRYTVEKEKEIYQAKINFFTNIAHEIRTPLSLITAPLENILNSGDGNAKTRSNLNIIKINTNRLLDLVNQLLDFRKVEENMFCFKFQYQDVVAIVRKVYNQYYPNAQLKGLELTLAVEQEQIFSSVDAEAIYKIISNLVSNAIKYAEKNIVMTVKVEGNNICITVSDDGKGIAETYHNKIFDPFFQVQDSQNTAKTGSGLGLSLSKSLAEKHHGTLQVANGEEHGCIFTLTLPISHSAEQQAALPEEHKDKPEEVPTNSDTSMHNKSKVRLLIVEDNADLREFLMDNLSADFSVVGAENGVIALQILEQENIDVIISDIMMPEMDGLELCDKIKGNVAYSHLPLILLSAKTDTPTKIDSLNRGADVYLEKPFSFEQLKAQINSIIENRDNIRNNFIKSPLIYFKRNTTEHDHNNAEFIEKLNAYIIENMSDERFSIDNLSESFYMSRSNFHKKIKNITGLTPNDYIKLIRLNQSVQLLASGKYKINEVCYMVGFNTPSYFSKCFYEHFGKLPKDFITHAKP